MINIWTLQAQGSGGGVVVTPATIFTTNLIGWWKADTGVFNAGGTTISDGQTVSTVLDNSGFAATMIQSLNGPVYKTAALNGLPALVFDNSAGTDAHLKTITATSCVLTNTAVLSVFYVTQMNGTTLNNGRLFSFLGVGDTNEAVDPTSSLICRLGSSDAFMSYRDSTNQMATSAIATGTTVRIGMVWNAANTIVSPYLNGTKGTDYTSTAANENFAGSGAAAICTQFIVGYTAPFAHNGWTGPISEVVLVNSAVSTTEAASLDGYFVGRGF